MSLIRVIDNIFGTMNNICGGLVSSVNDCISKIKENQEKITFKEIQQVLKSVDVDELKVLEILLKQIA